MVIHSVKKDVTPVIVNLLEKCGRQLSSIKTLIGFKLSIDGKVLTPSGALSGDNTSVFGLGDILYKEITYEEIAFWLVNNNVNLVKDDYFSKEIICSNVEATVKTIVFKGDKGTTLKLPCEYVTTDGDEFDLVADFEVAELSLLFLARNRFNELPEEFSYFRVYKDVWLTLARSTKPLCTVTWRDAGNNEDDINVDFCSNSEFVQEVFINDVKEVLRPILGGHN